MISSIEKERRRILEQLNGQGRLLERRSPTDALVLNKKLRQVVEWLTARAVDPRGLKRK